MLLVFANVEAQGAVSEILWGSTVIRQIISANVQKTSTPVRKDNYVHVKNVVGTLSIENVGYFVFQKHAAVSITNYLFYISIGMR